MNSKLSIIDVDSNSKFVEIARLDFCHKRRLYINNAFHSSSLLIINKD